MGIVVGSGYSAFQTFLQQLPTEFTAPSGSLFPTPTVNGQPITSYFAPSGALTPLQLSTGQVALSFAGPPVEYLLFQGAGLSFPINGSKLSSLGGTVTAAQLYSGGKFSAGAVSGGTELASLTFSSSQVALTVGTASLTLSGSGLPTAAATVQAIAAGTYSGPAIAIDQVQAVDGSTTTTLGLSASALTLSVVNPVAADSYQLALTGAFGDSLTAAQIDGLVTGSGFTASQGVGVTGIQYTSNGQSLSITLSATTLQATVGDYELTLTGTFPSLSLTADQLTTLVNGGGLPGLSASAITSAVVTQVSTGAVIESVTTATPGGVPLHDLHFTGGGPAAFVQSLFDTLAQVVQTETVSTSQTWVVSGSVADINDVVTSGGREFVSSGGQTTSISLYGKDSTGHAAELIVSSGGLASGVTIGSGGFEIVSGGGVTQDIVVSMGGELIVSSGGESDNVTVLSGGTIVEYDGDVINNFHIQPGGGVAFYREVFAGQALSGYFDTNNLQIDLGGIAVSADVIGTMHVYGTASGASVQGYESVSGVDIGASVGGSPYEVGSQYIFVGGSAQSTTILFHGLQVVSGGAAIVTVLSGGVERVASGGVVNGVTLDSGGVASGLSGATLANVTVSDGATLFLAVGAEASGVSLSPGAMIDLQGVSAATAAITGDDRILVSSGGSLVETIGLASGALSGLGVSTQPDGAVGTDIVFGSEDLSNLQTPVVGTSAGGQITFLDYTSDGLLLGTEVLTIPGGSTPRIEQYFTSLGTQYAASIEQYGGGVFYRQQDFDGTWNQKDATVIFLAAGLFEEVQTFDSAWNQTGASLSGNYGSQQVVQDFGGSWNQLSATITSEDAPDGITITQSFDGGWNQTSAVRVLNSGATVQTQYFDSAWRQTSATLVTSQGGTVETQDFDGGWNQTGATIVTQQNTSTTIAQHFDGAWNQIGADVTTVSGGVATDFQFNGAWGLLSSTVTTDLTSSQELIQAYDANGNHVVGEDRVIVQGENTTTSPTTFIFNGATGLPTTFVFTPPDGIDGDVFVGFINAATNSAAHDVLEFVGYGAGAQLTQIDASHWQITAPGLPTEVFTLSGGLSLAGGDVVFK
jgi:autotransporter passenger strand-loop-strand repeat protein